MRVLVTGINGFVGRYAAALLRKEGHEVIGLGRAAACAVAGVPYVSSRLGQCEDFARLREKLGVFDAVLHLAANLDMAFDAADVIQDNAQGMQDVLRLADGCRHFVYLSSIGVYGRPRCEPIDEQHPIAPLTVYHETKFFGEQLLDIYRNVHPDCTTVVLRMAAPVGVGMRRSFLPIVLAQAEKGEPITLYGQGGRVQSYIDVRDVARSLCVALGAKKSGLYNLGGARSYSNLRAAELCRDLCGGKSRISFTGTDAQEHDHWIVSQEKIRTELGFVPGYALQDTLRWMLESGGRA